METLGRVLLPRGAVVQVGRLALRAALPQAHRAAARHAAEPWGEQPPLAHPLPALAVPLAVLPAPITQGALGLDPLEGLVVNRGLVDVPRDHGAVVDHLDAVRAQREDGLDVLRTQATRRAGALEVGAPRRLDTLPGEPLGQTHPAVDAIGIIAQGGLDRLEGGACFVRHDEAAVLNGVAV
jgi:hypothetical protein